VHTCVRCVGIRIEGDQIGDGVRARPVAKESSLRRVYLEACAGTGASERYLANAPLYGWILWRAIQSLYWESKRAEAVTLE
jgi:hypothetical protein